MTEQNIALALSLVSMSASLGAWLNERRRHAVTKGQLWASRRELKRLTDRDERGRFVRRERGKAA